MLKQCCQFNEQKLDPWFCENFKSRLVLREFQIKTGFAGIVVNQDCYSRA